MNKANECTCPSGDGSLVHPCPAHPAVEQAGGDERKLSDLGNELHNLSCSIVHENEKLAEQIGGIARELWNWPQARAALAQPSPAQAEQAEAERPEVVGYLATAEHPKHGQPHKAFNYFKDQHDAQVAHWRERGCTVTEDRLMTVSQHDRIFWALRADRDSWAEQAEQLLADWDEMRKERDAAPARVAELKTMADNYCALLMDANAKLAEMERQEPVALANRGLHAFWVKWTEAAAGLYGPGLKLYASPVAQAQHSVPVAREQLERLVRILDAHNYAKDAEALMALLAAAPGKEGV
ncbi:TPA: hypothetical protein ACWV9D_003312 [Pseudomonas aeruginosa]